MIARGKCVCNENQKLITAKKCYLVKMQLYQNRKKHAINLVFLTNLYLNLTCLCHYLIYTENISGGMNENVTSSTGKGEIMNTLPQGCKIHTHQ